MSKRKENPIEETLNSLEKEELRLFHAYNRHATAQFKLDILNKLIQVINKIDVLKSIK